MGRVLIPRIALLSLVAVGAGDARSSAAPPAATVPPIAAPKLPAATSAPDIGDSFVRLTASASFASVRQGIERALAKELASGRREEIAPADLEEAADEHEGSRSKGEVRYRARVWRDPVQMTPARDSLRVRVPVAFTVDARGEGFEPVHCGTKSDPERGELGCLTRIGWRDDWGVEALSASLPTYYARRCKPTPPGVNFTKLVDRRAQEGAGARLPGLVDSLFREWRGQREVIAEGWHALIDALPLSLQGVSLDWDPKEALAAPLAAAGDSIVFDVSFRVRPRLVTAAAVQRAPRRNRPLPEPRVRLARDELRIPFDFEIPCDTLAERVLAGCDREGEAVRVASARVRAGGDRVAVSLKLRGALEGEVQFVGRLRYDPLKLRLEVPDLAPSPETERALRGLGTERTQEVRDLGQRALAALRVDLQEDVAAWASALGKVVQRPVGDLYLQGGMNRRELAGVYGGPETVGVRLVASGRAHLVRNY